MSDEKRIWLTSRYAFLSLISFRVADGSGEAALRESNGGSLVSLSRRLA